MRNLISDLAGARMSTRSPAHAQGRPCPSRPMKINPGNATERRDRLLHRNPMNRYGTPEGIVELVVRLSSERACFSKGARVTSAGGPPPGG